MTEEKQELLDYMEELFDYYIQQDYYVNELNDTLILKSQGDFCYEELVYLPIFKKEIIRLLYKRYNMIFDEKKSIYDVLVELQLVINKQ